MAFTDNHDKLTKSWFSQFPHYHNNSTFSPFTSTTDSENYSYAGLNSFSSI